MCARLKVADGQKPEAAQLKFDASLSVDAWSLPGGEPRAVAHTDGSPWWWRGEEDASISFLSSMGVVLDG